MKTNINSQTLKAKKLLEEKGYTCVFIKGEKEADYVNRINAHMEAAYRELQNLIFHISIDKL